MRPEHELKIGQHIVNSEARRDRSGRLTVYRLPSADGGGAYEVAGINDRFHPAAAKRLASLVQRRRFSEAEQAAVEYILDYTDVAGGWSKVPAIQAVLRDTAFNRGPTGAARILQMALGFAGDSVDGDVGPKTLRALRGAEKEPRAFLLRFREAREAYERRIAPPVGKRAKFWKGLVNRWDQTTKFGNTLV